MECLWAGGGVSHKLVVKEIIRSQKAQIVILQESKLKEVFERVLKEIWGRRLVDWVAVEAVGAAGGLLYLWDTRTISVERSWVDVFSLSVLVEDLKNNKKLASNLSLWS